MGRSCLKQLRLWHKREVPGSILVPDSYYPNWSYTSFSSVLLGNYQYTSTFEYVTSASYNILPNSDDFMLYWQRR
jgi:hypothetical protein